jgi:hypothetical protein
MGDFDLRVFWRGQPYCGDLPSYVRLYSREDNEGLKPGDLLGNPLSWQMFSERLLEWTWPLIKADVQLFDVPLYRKSTGIRVPGYKLVNPIRVIDCIDWEHSEFARDDEGSILHCDRLCIRDHQVGNHHLFRLAGYLHPVIVSDEFVQRTFNKGVRGLAYIRCRVPGSKRRTR